MLWASPPCLNPTSYPTPRTPPCLIPCLNPASHPTPRPALPASLLPAPPAQAALVRPMGAIRRATAGKTDERVRLTSEVIQVGR